MTTKKFFGIKPPIDIVEQISKLIDDNRHLIVQKDWESADKLHITLAFLGNHDYDSKAVYRQLQPHKKFVVDLKGYGTFPYSNALFLKPDAGVREIKDLSHMLYRIHRLKSTFGAMTPHLTLIKGAPLPDLRGRFDRVYYGPWIVDHFSLFENVDSKYKEIERFELS